MDEVHAVNWIKSIVNRYLFGECAFGSSHLRCIGWDRYGFVTLSESILQMSMSMSCFLSVTLSYTARLFGDDSEGCQHEKPSCTGLDCTVASTPNQATGVPLKTHC